MYRKEFIESRPENSRPVFKTLFKQLDELNNITKKPVSDFNDVDVQVALSLMKFTTKASLSSKLSHLRSYYDFLLKQGIIVTNPINNVDLTQLWKTIEESNEKFLWSQNDMYIIYRIIQSDGRIDADFINTAYQYIYEGGYDFTEGTWLLYNLNRSDIKENNIIEIKSYNNDQRKIYISEYLKTRLLKLYERSTDNNGKKVYGANSESVFKTSKKDVKADSFSYQQFKKRLYQISETVKKISGKNITINKLHISGILNSISIESRMEGKSIAEVFTPSNFNHIGLHQDNVELIERVMKQHGTMPSDCEKCRRKIGNFVSTYGSQCDIFS